MNDLPFFIESALLGVGLAMDAFCVSVANSLANPNMKFSRMNLIAFSFAFFQYIMPLAGWFLVTTLLGVFNALSSYIPWLSMSVLWFLGVKMIIDGRVKKKTDEGFSSDVILSFGMLMVQAVATSIDALSAGLTFTAFSLSRVLVACAVIAVITYTLCMIGLKIGKVAGVKLSKWAAALGGCILIFIGAWTFLS